MISNSFTFESVHPRIINLDSQTRGGGGTEPSIGPYIRGCGMPHEEGMSSRGSCVVEKSHRPARCVSAKISSRILLLTLVVAIEDELTHSHECCVSAKEDRTTITLTRSSERIAIGSANAFIWTRNVFAAVLLDMHERNLSQILSNQTANQIVLTMHRLIWNQTDSVRLLFQINRKMVNTI